MQRRCEQAQQEPVYGLRAYRYAGDMTLMQAIGRELERSSRVNLIENHQLKKHLFQ